MPYAVPPDVNLIVAEAAKAPARGHARKSALYLWLRTNHDRLVAEFGNNPPSWGRFAEVLGAHGVLDGDGKPPSARGARGAWYRVRQDVEKARSKPGTRLATGEMAAGVHTSGVGLPLSPEPGDYQEPPARRFRMATLRGEEASSAASASRPKPAPTNPEKRNVDEIMAEFMGRPSGTGFKPATSNGDE